MKRLVRWFFVSVFPPVFAVACVLWTTHASPPVEMHGMYFVGTYVQPSDGNFAIRMVGDKYRDCPVVVKEELIDSHGSSHLLPLRLGVVDTTGPFDSTIKYRLPTDSGPFPEGLTTFRSTAVYSPDYLKGCFQTYTVGAPQRPDVRFWVGDSPPPWARR